MTTSNEEHHHNSNNNQEHWNPFQQLREHLNLGHQERTEEKEETNKMHRIMYAIFWMLVLWFFVWPLAFFCSWWWIMLQVRFVKDK